MKRPSTLVRKAALIGMLAAVLSPFAGVRLAAQDPTEAELRRLTEAFAQAWAKADPKALAGLHTSEAIHVGSDGKVSVGRAAIERAMTEALAGVYRGTKIGLTNGQTTRAGQDVYVSEGTYAVSGGMPPAGVATRGRYMATLVRVSGRWQFAGFAEIGAVRPPK
jgi:uncharacterized protein (TIGR02246 family)